jgi:hypothetical protein
MALGNGKGEKGEDRKINPWPSENSGRTYLVRPYVRRSCVWLQHAVRLLWIANWAKSKSMRRLLIARPHTIKAYEGRAYDRAEKFRRHADLSTRDRSHCYKLNASFIREVPSSNLGRGNPSSTAVTGFACVSLVPPGKLSVQQQYLK